MWNGAFSPVINKSIGTIRFVPLLSMTPRDWQWLDYENIRTVARNRIATMIVRGRLRGFFQVMIVEKAAKNEYFWPAGPEEIQQFAENDTTPFTNEKDVDTIEDAVDRLEGVRFSLSLLPLQVLVQIVKVLAEYMEQELQEQLRNFSEEDLNELTKEAQTLLTASVMLWEFSLEEAESLIDDIPESDEVDEVRDWINDRVAEVERARRQIAAGRGLTPSS